jgi:hypothetical protein
VGDWCIVDADAAVLCPASEFDSCEWRAQICDDSVGHAEAMHDILDELNCLGYAVLDEWFVFDPLVNLSMATKIYLKLPLALLRGPT